MKRALVIVDVQQFFLQRAPAELPSRISDHIISSNYDLIVFTVFQNFDGSNFERSIKWDKCKNDDDLNIPDILSEFITNDNLFIKHTYSAFKQNEFEDYLTSNNIDKLDICGIDMDGCVLATAFEAFDKNYQVNVLENLSFSHAGLETEAKSIFSRNIQSKNH